MTTSTAPRRHGHPRGDHPGRAEHRPTSARREVAPLAATHPPTPAEREAEHTIVAQLTAGAPAASPVLSTPRPALPSVPADHPAWIRPGLRVRTLLPAGRRPR